MRGLCRLHQRLGPYRHHTSQTSFCANSARSMQELEAFRHVAASIPTENGTQMETCIAQTMRFSDKAVGHCREGEHSHVACGWQAPEIGKCARDANVSKLRKQVELCSGSESRSPRFEFKANYSDKRCCPTQNKQSCCVLCRTET